MKSVLFRAPASTKACVNSVGHRRASAIAVQWTVGMANNQFKPKREVSRGAATFRKLLLSGL